MKHFPTAHENFSITDLRNCIEDSRTKDWQAVYILVVSSAKKKPITAAEIGVETSSWKLLTEQYHNKKRKKVLRVYRYISPEIARR